MTETKEQTKPTILYVDDEPINLDVLKINLRKQFNVLTAESAKEGLVVLDSNPEIKIVISDMRMPEITGLEFIKMARDQFPNVVYCVLTGYEITDEIKFALETGHIKQYFKKPFEAPILRQTLNDLLEL